MAKTLEPIEVGTVTPVRRMRSVTMRIDFDSAEASGKARVTATLDYEVTHPDGAGKEVFPAKHGGFVELGDEAVRAVPGLMQTLTALDGAGEAALEERTKQGSPLGGLLSAD